MRKDITEKGYYIVCYCPKCKCQRTFHTISLNLYKCDLCDIEMPYSYKMRRLSL